MDSPPPGTWLDPQPLQRSWPEPAPPLQIPRRLRIGIPLLAVGLAVGLVVGLGGFETRQDQSQVMAVGAELDCEDLVYTFDSATVQKVENLAGEPAWEVWALGTARNPNDEPLGPGTGEGGSLAVRGAPGPEIANAESVTIGDEESARSAVPPGDVAVPLRVGFELPGSYQPSDRLQLATIVMEYTDNSVLGLGGGERSWNKTDDAWTVFLPVTQLPAEETY